MQKEGNTSGASKRSKELLNAPEFESGNYAMSKDTDGFIVINKKTGYPASYKPAKEVQKDYIRENVQKIQDAGADEIIEVFTGLTNRNQSQEADLNDVIAEELAELMTKDEFVRIAGEAFLSPELEKNYFKATDSNIDTEIEIINDQYYGGREVITSDMVADFVASNPSGVKNYKKNKTSLDPRFEGFTLAGIKQDFLKKTGLPLTPTNVETYIDSLSNLDLDEEARKLYEQSEEYGKGELETAQEAAEIEAAEQNALQRIANPSANRPEVAGTKTELTQKLAQAASSGVSIDDAFELIKDPEPDTSGLPNSLVRVMQSFPGTRFVVDEKKFEREAKKHGATKESRGFVTSDGRIYINPKKATAKTPIHEVGHVWVAGIKSQNQKLHDRGLSVVQGTQYEQEAKANGYTGDEALEEALVEAIADKGNKILEQEKQSKFTKWRTDLWKWVKGKLNIKDGVEVENLTLDQIVDQAVSDILGGENLGIKSETTGGAKLSKGPEAQLEAVIAAYYETTSKSKIVQALNKKTNLSKKEAEILYDRVAERLSGKTFRSVEGAGKRRKKAFLNFVLESRISTSTKRILGLEEKAYAQISIKEMNSMAKDIISVLTDQGMTLRDIFKEIKDPSSLPYMMDRLHVGAVLQDQAGQLGQHRLRAEIIRWMDEMGRDIGKGLQAFRRERVPELAILEMEQRSEEIQKAKMTKKGPDGTTPRQNIRELQKEVAPDPEQAASVVEKVSVQKKAAPIKKKVRRDRVEKLRKKSDQARAKIKSGLDKLKGLKSTGQANASIIGLTPEQLSGLKEIAEGLVQLGYYSAKIFKEQMAAALAGYDINAPEVADYMWEQIKPNLEAVKNGGVGAEKLGERIMSNILPRQKKKKDILDKLVDGLYRNAREIININERQEPQKAAEKLADLVRNYEVTIDMWDGAKQYVDEYIDALPLEMAAKEELRANLEDFMHKTIGEPFGRSDLRKAIREGAKDFDVSLRDLIKKHYSKVDEESRGLAGKIVSDLGLNQGQALALANSIHSEIMAMNEERQMKALERRLIPKSRKPSKKENRRMKKIIEEINMGALDKPDFEKLFSEMYGFPALSADQKLKIKNALAVINSGVEGSYKRKKISELEAMLDSLGDASFASWFISKVLVEHYYYSLLSRPSTLFRGGVGAAITTATQMGVNMIVNPKDALEGWKQFQRGRKKGQAIFKQIWKTGHSELEATDEKGNYAVLREVINTPVVDHVRKISAEDKILKKLQKTAGLSYKIGMSIPAKMVRTLMAMDAIFNYGTREYFSYIAEVNKGLMSIEDGGLGMDRSDADFYTSVHERLANNKAHQDLADQKIQDEIAILEDLGETVPAEYAAVRKIEIIEEMRDAEIQAYARYRGKKGTLTNKPEGVLGKIYAGVSFFTTPKDTDNVIWAGAQMIIKSFLPILRVPTNQLNEWADWFLPVALTRAYTGWRNYRNDTSTFTRSAKGKVEVLRVSNRDIVLEHLVKGAIGTAAFIGLLLWMFDFEEDDNGNVIVSLSDIPIQITAGGHSGNKAYLKDRSIDADWKEFSIRFRIYGEWTQWNSYKDWPIAPLLANLGYMSDEVRYGKESKNGKATAETRFEFLMTTGFMKSMFMVKEQNYFQAIDDILSSIDENKSPAQMIGKNISRPAKTLWWPGVFEQMYKFNKAFKKEARQRPSKYRDGFWRAFQHNMYKNVPYLDGMINNSQFDQLGYDIPEVFNVPYTPEKIPVVTDMWLDYVERVYNRQANKPEWEIIYKYPEVNIGGYITAPRKIGNTELDSEAKREFEKMAAIEFRNLIRGEMGSLGLMKPEPLQTRLDQLKRVARNVAKAKFISK